MTNKNSPFFSSLSLAIALLVELVPFESAIEGTSNALRLREGNGTLSGGPRGLNGDGSRSEGEDSGELHDRGRDVECMYRKVV